MSAELSANTANQPQNLRCELCNVSVQYSNQLRQHLRGRRHKKKLWESRKQKAKTQQGVEIKGVKIEPVNTVTTNESNGESRKRKFEEIEELPQILLSVPKGKTNEQVLEYFSLFGAIKRTDIDSEKSVIRMQYESKYDTYKVMTKRHFIDGQKIIIAWVNPNAEGPEYNMNRKQLLNHIKQHITFDAQIHSFVQYITCDVTLYLKVKHDMEEELRVLYPDCVVWPNGSFATSLQFKTDKMDIFLGNTNDEDCLENTKTLLTNGKKFKNVFVCETEDIPYVGCKHIVTGIDCMMNTRSFMAVKNSELIKYYVDLNVKVRSFILVVKFWAKSHGIVNKNSSLSNYSLFIMCIFYLQQKHSFPSVEQLQFETIPTELGTIWNLNLSQEMIYSTKCELNTTLRLLLHGFFTFYADFDYGSKIISPYLGETIDKTSFLNQNTVPEKFRIYKEKFFVIDPLNCDTPIIIQDPFIHNDNITTLVDVLDLTKYVKKCRVGQSRLSQISEAKMLFGLFTLTSKIEFPHSYFVCIKQNVAQNAAKNLECDWFQRVKHFLSIVLEKIFKFHMSELILEKNGHFARYRAASSVDVWTDRDKYASSIEDKLERCRTILGREILITDVICNNSTMKTESSILFENYISVIYNEKTMEVNVSFERINNGDNDKNFYLFFELFNKELCSWFEKYERELDEVF